MKKIAFIFYALLFIIVILFFTFRNNNSIETETEIDVIEESVTNADFDSIMANKDNLYRNLN